MSLAEWATLVTLSGFVGLVGMTALNARSMVRQRTPISIVRALVPVVGIVISLGLVSIIARLTDPGLQLSPPPYQVIPQQISNWLVAGSLWFGLLGSYLTLGELRREGH
jgi:hypothetical protein